MVKAALMGILAFLFIHANGQKTKEGTKEDSIKVPMEADYWNFKDSVVSFVIYRGKKAMEILPRPAIIVAKNLTFKSGTIEYDFFSKNHSIPSLYFHRLNGREAEIFYVRDRLNQPYANDVIQYAPVIDGVILWDLYGAYQGPALIKPDQWNHVKLVISGWQMRVYINNIERPALQIPRLEGNAREGEIGFEDPGLVADLVIKPDATENLPASAAPDLTDQDANYIRDWRLTDTADLPLGNELNYLNLPSDKSYKYTIHSERGGLINLTRRFGATDRRHRRVVWLKVNIHARQETHDVLQLGFSDEVWLFLNRREVYVDKNLYLQNMRKYPDGRISILNSSVPLIFKKGENELIIGVANNFYGWGIIARLKNMDAIENISD